MMNHTEVEATVRCSIILTGGNDSSRLSAYLRTLAAMKLSESYEPIIINDQRLQIDQRQLRALLPAAKVLNPDRPLTQEQSFDMGAIAARGKYLLLVKSLVSFDELVLEESINDLETSNEKVSISANKNFVLVEKAYYVRTSGVQTLLGCLNLTGQEQPSVPSEQVTQFRNLHNQPVPFKSGPRTFIDPEVIMDSPESVKIGSNCIIRKGVVLRPEGGEIIIGDNCVINHYCVFHGKGGIHLGDWTIVAPHCGFYAQNHTYKSFDIPITKQPNMGKGIYLVGDNWVHGHSVICDDVTIGKGAVVAANSTVTQSVPMASIAAGSPARVIKKRYTGNWDFHRQERAASEGMPENICEHVKKRGLLIRKLIEPEDRILDVGCGEGIITAILAEKTPDIVGCDYSIEAIKIAKERHPHIEFVYSNSTNFAFPNNSFTKVTMSDVAEHLMPVQFIKTLKEIRRVLKRAGKLILTTPLTGRGANSPKYAHIYEYSEADIKNILGKMFCNVRLTNIEFGLLVAQKG